MPIVLPQSAEIPSRPLAYHLEDFWYGFPDGGGLRQDARDAVLHDQAVLSVPALCHIHYGSEVFDWLSRLVENRMPNRVQVPDGPIGEHDPVLLLVFGF